jgi:phage gp36-like protein
MAYADFDDVLRRYTPLETLIGSGDVYVTTADICSIFIADAEGIVDAYLSGRYVIPLASEPLLTSVTADIALFRVLSDRAPRVPEFMVGRHDRAIQTLEMLRDGKMNLTASSQSVTSGGDQEAWSNVVDGSNPVFKPVEEYPACRRDLEE